MAIATMKPGTIYTLRSWSYERLFKNAKFAHDILGDSYDTVIRRNWTGRWYVQLVVDGVRMQEEGWAKYKRAKGWA